MSSTVAQNVYQKRLAHSKVVYVADNNLLVDTGIDSEWDALQEFLEDHGDVDRLFLSHAHGDHVGNAERVVAEYDLEVFVPENEPLDELDLSEATIETVTDGQEFVPGVTAVEVPGHTEGICALYLPQKELLLCTDVLDGADRRGLPAGFLLPPPAMYNWDSKKAETNLEKLLELSFNTAVVTHGTNVTDDPKTKLETYLDFPNHYRQELLENIS